MTKRRFYRLLLCLIAAAATVVIMYRSCYYSTYVPKFRIEGIEMQRVSYESSDLNSDSLQYMIKLKLADYGKTDRYTPVYYPSYIYGAVDTIKNILIVDVSKRDITSDFEGIAQLIYYANSLTIEVRDLQYDKSQGVHYLTMPCGATKVDKFPRTVYIVFQDRMISSKVNNTPISIKEYYQNN